MRSFEGNKHPARGFTCFLNLESIYIYIYLLVHNISNEQNTCTIASERDRNHHSTANSTEAVSAVGILQINNT